MYKKIKPLNIHPHTIFTGLLIGSSLLAAPSFAAGFQVNENRAAGVATSHADAAAAEDASVLADNPASIANLDGTHATLTLVGINAKFNYTDRGTTNANGGQMSGGNGGNPGGFTPVGANFITHQINDRLYIGGGIYAPYGLPTKYQDGWIGRYQALKTDLKTINFAPSLAFKLNEQVMVGAAAIANYSHAQFTNGIGLGLNPSAPASSLLSCNSALIAICNIANPLLSPLGPSLATGDGGVNVKMKSWGYGYNLGSLVKLNDDARVSLSYHSHIKQKMDGSVRVQYGTVGLDATRSAHTTIDLPEVASISYYQNVLPNLSLMADVSWTRWSRFNEVRVRFDDPTLPDVVVPENWHNTTRVALGGEYRLSEKHTLRAGAALDPSPVDDQNRTARIPDADRVWVSFGYQYNMNKNMSLDLGYAHLFVKDGTISDSHSAMTGGTQVGSYSGGRADLLGISLYQKF